MTDEEIFKESSNCVFESLALALRDAIIDSDCCIDRAVDLNLLDYIILVECLEKHGFRNDRDTDRNVDVMTSFTRLEDYFRDNYEQKGERFLKKRLMLNPILCSYFKQQLELVGWNYQKNNKV